MFEPDAVAMDSAIIVNTTSPSGSNLADNYTLLREKIVQHSFGNGIT
jgi:hypothetical protein